MVGYFLAYQFITDINYSTLTDFSEMEFTVPGPGTRSRCPGWDPQMLREYRGALAG